MLPPAHGLPKLRTKFVIVKPTKSNSNFEVKPSEIMKEINFYSIS
jgi:hypothetical protein